MPPHAGANEVAAIDGEHLQLVLGRIDVMNGEIHLAVTELVSDPVLHLIVGLAAGVDGFLVELHRVLFIDLGEER